jgi:ankyrin repeat protein
LTGSEAEKQWRREHPRGYHLMHQRSDEGDDEEEEEDITGETNELHEAAKNGDVEGVRELLKNQSELVNARDENGWTPLHVSISRTSNK